MVPPCSSTGLCTRLCSVEAIGRVMHMLSRDYFTSRADCGEGGEAAVNKCCAAGAGGK